MHTQNDRSALEPASDEIIEQEIVDAGLTAPRLTPADIQAVIVDETYTRLDGTTTTICLLKLANGFTVTGESACVSAENFDQEIGCQIAYKNAVGKVWALEGYLLAQRLYLATQTLACDSIEPIAKVCHEVNRAYCQALGDNSQAAWDEAPAWQRESARMGVNLHLMGDHGPEASHISWRAQKERDGWTYGEVKNADAKTHPCMVPFDQLSPEQQAKDYIFRAIVHAMK